MYHIYEITILMAGLNYYDHFYMTIKDGNYGHYNEN